MRALLWLPPVALVVWALAVTLFDDGADGLQWATVVLGLVAYAVVLAVALLLRRRRTP